MSRFYVKIILLLACFAVCRPSLNAQSFKTLLYSGDKAFEDGNYYAASDFYEQALNLYSDLPDLHYKMAEACRLDNNYKKAARYYRKLLPDYREEYPLAEYYLAQMLKSTGKYLKAQHYFSRFKKHYAKNHASDYFLLSAENEILACEKAEMLMLLPKAINVLAFNRDINSYYADFCIDGVNDSLLFFTSIRPDSLTREFYAKIYCQSTETVTELPATINTPGLDVSNPFWDNKNACLYYTVSNANSTCIYCSDYKNGQWENVRKLPSQVNADACINTQPMVFHFDENSWIVYASDKAGGVGGFDIYYNQMFENGTFGECNAWGRKKQGKSKYAYLEDTSDRFNTMGNEITPFYNVNDSCLYFSSDWYGGLGGYDIFKMKALPGDTGRIENMGYPVNSPQNDVYFRFDRNLEKAFLTSNRNEALARKHQSCCHDVFYYDLLKSEPEVETVKKEIITMTEIAEELIPITLYFHNDRPNPRTRDTVTQINYETSFEAYMQRQSEYSRKFSEGLNGNDLQRAKDSIEHFFVEDVNGEFQKLRKFMLVLSELLERNQRVVMTIKGYTSPLNTPEYNLCLAKRRISSLENYVREYRSGLLLPYINSGLLEIRRVPFGETKVKKGISDDPNDRRNSVYNPLAARERKIQVIAVKINTVEEEVVED